MALMRYERGVVEVLIPQVVSQPVARHPVKQSIRLAIENPAATPKGSLGYQPLA
jgi:hypothetical protein